MFYASAFGSLWLLTRFLPIEAYGAYAFSIALVWFLSVIATSGLEQTVMIRVARGDGTTGLDRGKHLAGSALVTVTAMGCLVGTILYAAAPVIAGWTDLPGLETWLAGMAPVVPLLAISAVYEGWFVALGRVGPSQIFPALGHALRLPLLAVALLLGGGVTDVILVEIAVAALPILLFAISARGPWGGRFALPAAGDLRDGGALMVAKAANDGARRIDIFMLGLLASAAAIGEYAVAARLVVAVDLGRELFQPAFTSRGGAIDRRWRQGGAAPRI